MRSRMRGVSFLAFFVLLFAAVLALPVDRADAAAEVEEIKTPKGLTLWYVREPAIPIIALSVQFLSGSALDPQGKEGLASFVSGMLNEGAGEMDSQAFQRAIINDAIGFSANASLDGFLIDLQTLSTKRETAFSLLGLALTKPRFDVDAVERVRAQFVQILSDAKHDPNKRSALGWFRLAFGAHPYGAPTDGTEASIATITVDDLKAYAKGRFARDNVVIGASGDVEPAEIARLVDLALGDLPATAASAELPEAAFLAAGKIAVERIDVPQSVVSFGLPGLKREDPDFYAAYVMNYVLGGGGFTSRLYQEVREKRGLAYSVYSYLQPLKAAGLYLGGVATENSRVAESLALIKDAIARMANEGVTEEELAAAKRHLTGAYPLRFDTGAKIADMLVGVQIDKLGIDYFQKRNDLINGVTVADIARVAKRLLDPSKLVVVVAGNPTGIEPTP